MKIKKKAMVLARGIRRLGVLGHIEAQVAGKFLVRGRGNEMPEDVVSRLESAGLVFWDGTSPVLTDVGNLIAGGRLTVD